MHILLLIDNTPLMSHLKITVNLTLTLSG